MTRNRTHKLTIFTLALAIAGVTGGRAALALSVPAINGSVANPQINFAAQTTNLACMRGSGLSGGAIQNQCGSVQGWRIPLAVNEGPHTVFVSGTNSGSGLSCALISMTQTGGLAGLTGFVPFPAGTSVLALTVTVPNSGALLLNCSLGANSQVHDANYNQ